MFVGKVKGSLWATRKDEKLNGLKFLVVLAQITFPSSSTVVPNIIATSAFIGFSNKNFLPSTSIISFPS